MLFFVNLSGASASLWRPHWLSYSSKWRWKDSVMGSLSMSTGPPTCSCHLSSFCWASNRWKWQCHSQWLPQWGVEHRWRRSSGGQLQMGSSGWWRGMQHRTPWSQEKSLVQTRWQEGSPRSQWGAYLNRRVWARVRCRRRNGQSDLSCRTTVEPWKLWVESWKTRKPSTILRPAGGRHYCLR